MHQTLNLRSLSELFYLKNIKHRSIIPRSWMEFTQQSKWSPRPSWRALSQRQATRNCKCSQSLLPCFATIRVCTSLLHVMLNVISSQSFRKHEHNVVMVTPGPGWKCPWDLQADFAVQSPLATRQSECQLAVYHQNNCGPAPHARQGIK